ncbi:MAG: anthranilate synthase component I [Bdellovibrionales bacterium]
MASPDFNTFKTHFNAGKTQLLHRWIAADLVTPVSAYLKLSRDKTHHVLFESVEGGQTLGRYSIIGFDPDLIWTCHKGQVEITYPAPSLHGHLKNASVQSTSALKSLRETVNANRIDITDPTLPPMAVSGLFGYIGYDMVRLIEDTPDTNPDNLQIPDSILMRPSALAIFDNVKNMICIVVPIYTHTGNSDAPAQDIYDTACAKLDAIAKTIDSPLDRNHLTSTTRLTTPLTVNSNMTRADYHTAVTKAVDYIHQGEIFQVVPGQRFDVDFDLPSTELYRALRRLNPSPFMFHVQCGDFAIVGSSPEILVRVRGGTATIRPIAGTRKRGTTEAEDRALAEDLLSDPKERAEHLMLLDLGRNDIGRIADFGSVKVTDQFIIERYSHVMHIVSNVEGRLRKGLDCIDALFAGFPAGTVSGAPKVRAMEIIDALEKSRRGYYGGGVGYISGNGEMDTCIALRTALVKDGKVYVQAGGGVVADSDPEFEYQETINKSKAVIKAAELAVENAR